MITYGKQAALPDGTPVPLTDCVKLGNQLFLSGQLPFDASGKISATDIEGQTRQVMDNIVAVLTREGASLSTVVKATIWLVDKADFPGFNKVYAGYFDGAYPARSTVCSDLMVPGAKLEIEVTAIIP